MPRNEPRFEKQTNKQKHSLSIRQSCAKENPDHETKTGEGHGRGCVGWKEGEKVMVSLRSQFWGRVPARPVGFVPLL